MQGQNGTIPSQATMEAAADWLIRLRAFPDDEALFARFEAWLAAAPEHERAFEAQCRAWNLMGALRPRHALSATAPRPPAPTDRRRQAPRRQEAAPRRAPGRWRIGALAALAACLALLFLPDLLIRLQADHVTGTGEVRSVRLEDGSTITLGGRSALAASVSDGQRRVRLLSGEAYFEVSPDAARPFTVDATSTHVRVLGTAFNIRLGADTSDVALAHGSVEARFGDKAAQALKMIPGERLRFDAANGDVTRDQVPIEEIGAWRAGRLVVMDATVGEVVERIRRYHSGWIAVPDGTLAAERVTGVYDLRDADAALAALVEPFGGKVHALSPLLRIVVRF